MVTQMTIPEKLEALRSCIAKCDDVEYSVQVALGDNKEETLAELSTLVENGRKLFLTGQIDNLDYDVRQDAYNKWNAKLDEKLSMFPEYSIAVEEEVKMHM